MNEKLRAERKERKDARIVIYGELVFFVLPFLIMAFVHSSKNDLASIDSSPEWSLAATILAGQTIMRFISGWLKYEGKKSWQRITLYVILIFVLAILCVVDFVSLLNGNVSPIFIWSQYVLFVMSMIAFVVFGSIGERLLELPSYTT